MHLSFFVPGAPVPKGSTRAFVVKGKAITTATNRHKQIPWASAIAYSGLQAMEHAKPYKRAVMVSLVFVFQRPKSHYGTGRNADEVKDSAPDRHVYKPDLDKLTRCALDSLTSVVWNDDSQVDSIYATKTYGDAPGVHITITGVE